MDISALDNLGQSCHDIANIFLFKRGGYPEMRQLLEETYTSNPKEFKMASMALKGHFPEFRQFYPEKLDLPIEAEETTVEGDTEMQQ